MIYISLSLTLLEILYLSVPYLFEWMLKQQPFGSEAFFCSTCLRAISCKPQFSRNIANVAAQNIYDKIGRYHSKGNLLVNNKTITKCKSSMQQAQFFARSICWTINALYNGSHATMIFYLSLCWKCPVARNTVCEDFFSAKNSYEVPGTALLENF